MVKINLFLDDENGGLYQWDTGQRLRLHGVKAGARVDYVMGTQVLSVDTYADGGNVYADIPNILLQQSGNIRVLVYVTGEGYGETVKEARFPVHPREKPSDYVYTETEVKRWDDLTERVEDLEKHPVSEGAIASAVGKYLDENPVVTEENDPTVPEWAKQPEKPTYTAEEVGALPDTTVIPTVLPNPNPLIIHDRGDVVVYNGAEGAQIQIPAVPTNVSDFTNDAGYLTQDDLQSATDAALAQAKKSGEFDGEKGDKGDPGAPGATPNLQIGDVETLPAGSNATASIAGTLEDPILHLGIPRGADGKDGAGGSGGTDIALGMTGAEVGQIAKITAVDDNGKPTAWEPVEFPNGEKWELLAGLDTATASEFVVDFPAPMKSLFIYIFATDTAGEQYKESTNAYRDVHFKVSPGGNYLKLGVPFGMCSHSWHGTSTLKLETIKNTYVQGVKTWALSSASCSAVALTGYTATNYFYGNHATPGVHIYGIKITETLPVTTNENGESVSVENVSTGIIRIYGVRA